VRLTDQISDTERLTRFITDKDYYRPLRPAVEQLHFRAFLPSRNEPDELSIFRTQGLIDSSVWSLADREITAQSNRKVIARGDFVAPNVRACAIESWRLNVRVDEPPIGHAIIHQWPPLEDTETRKSLAQQLRAFASPRQAPS
jgi:hypothetical protein